MISVPLASFNQFSVQSMSQNTKQTDKGLKYINRLTVSDVLHAEAVSLIGRVGYEANEEIPCSCYD